MVKYNSYKDIDAAGAAFQMALAPEKGRGPRSGKDH